MSAVFDEEEFNRVLLGSNKPCEAIGLHFTIKYPGVYDVHIPEIVCRPHYAVRMDYSDKGDMRLIRRGDGRIIKFEVKGRSLVFTNRRTFPFKTVDVETVDKVRRGYRPHLYFIVNSAITHAAVVRPSTKHLWTTAMRPDTTRPGLREFYTCPKEEVDFIRLEGS